MNIDGHDSDPGKKRKRDGAAGHGSVSNSPFMNRGSYTPSSNYSRGNTPPIQSSSGIYGITGSASRKLLRSLISVRLDNVVGAGTFGVVFKAEDKETGEAVALKKIKFEMKDEKKMMEGFPLTVNICVVLPFCS